MTANHPIRIAIVGGGIGGSTLFQALHNKHNLDVHLFEAAPNYKTAGYFISFGANAIGALEVLGLEDRLTATNPVRPSGQKMYIAAGKDAGKLAYTRSIEDETMLKQSNTTQRHRFLAEMLKDVDQSRLHLAKKLRCISETEDKDNLIILEFEDGSRHTCDILVGADGIYSLVRKYIVGPEDPSAVPSFAGWQCVWIEVPVEDALHYLGKELVNLDDSQVYSWSGYKTWMMHNLTNEKTRVSCIVVRTVEDDDSSGRKVTRAELKDWVKDFDLLIGKAMVSLLTRNGVEELDMLPLQHHNPQASRYVKDGRMTIVGDAADATVPFRASAGSFALEDAAILGACFEKVNTLTDASAALRAYQIIQKPRRARLVRESYQLGRLNSGCIQDVGLDAEKISKWLEGS